MSLAHNRRRGAHDRGDSGKASADHPVESVNGDSSATPPYRGLLDITRLLDELEIPYWVDSGVLLGLVRSGRLNAWEKDIDLGIWKDGFDALIAAEDRLRALGYTIVVSRYRGLPYGISLKPVEGEGARLRVSIHVFYAVGPYAWSPQVQIYVPPPAPDILENRRRSWPGEILRRMLLRWVYSREAREGTAESPAETIHSGSLAYRLARWANRRIDRGLTAEIWPMREIYMPLTWIIPTELLWPLKRLPVGGHTVAVPERAEEYLAYRYGDWKTPRQTWWYWVEDGGIRRENPLKVWKQIKEQSQTE